MNKPDQPRKAIVPRGKRPRTIRQQLEHDAWTNHGRLAARMSGRKARRHREPGGGLIKPSPARDRRSLSRQDRTLLTVSLVLLLLLLSARAAMAQGNELWGIEFRGDDSPQFSVALGTEIKAEITGMVARIDVRQRFRNTGHAWSEAIYRFPLPAGAAVDRLLIDAGGRTVEGEIREKQETKHRHQRARAEGMVATLVEQQRANQFETRMANIGPGEEITIAISFLAQVDYRDATFSLQIPLTFTPRGDALDDHSLTLSIRLHGNINIASLESRYHDMETHPTLGGYDLYLADPDTRTDRVFQLDWKPDFGPDPETALMTWEDSEAVYALLMLAPPLEQALAPQARELVFVVDTSGSMEGASLQQAKAALYQGLGQLEPANRFNLIEFNSDSYLLFEQSQEPSDARLVEAMDFIDALVTDGEADGAADGGTNMQAALAQAMHLPAQPGLLRQIVFITDGSVDHEQELLLQLADELGESRLFAVSIGPAPNERFMRKAAVIGRGSHTHIDKLDEIEARMSSLWRRIGHLALQDICVDWGMPAESYPEIVPDLYAGDPLWVFARLPAAPQEVTLCGKLNGQPWELATRPLAGNGTAELATLWARARIEALEGSRMFGLDEELVRLQVTEVALQYSLLTPNTSLVAIDRTPARPAGEKLGGSEIASLLPAGSSMDVAGFSSTASGWPAQLAYSLATLLSAASLLWFSTPSRRVQAGGPPPLPLQAIAKACIEPCAN